MDLEDLVFESDFVGLDQFAPMSAELENGDNSLDLTEFDNFDTGFLKSLDIEAFGDGIDLFICPFYLSNILFCLSHRPQFDHLYRLPRWDWEGIHQPGYEFVYLLLWINW